MVNFISDFQQLLLDKPRYNVKHVNAENCDYSDTAVNSSNCYYSFAVFYCENVYYARYSRKCNNCSGLTFCVNCEWCVECVDCVGCNNCDYCQDCQNSSDCQFCKDCFGCRDCFGCVGLHQKKYHMFNEQLSQEEYEKRMAQLDLTDLNHRQLVLDKVKELQGKATNLGIHQFKTEDCIGDHLTECKNCYQCYDAFALEDCLYNIECNGNNNCCDMTVCFEAEWCYNSVQAPLNHNCNLLMHTDNCSDSEFCAYSKNLKNCFGCVYLNNKEYHILNEPYSKEDYEKKVKEIKEDLISKHKYNLSIYIVSDYEKKRLETESDPVVQSLIPKS